MKKRICSMICLCILVSVMLCACGKQQIGTNAESGNATKASEKGVSSQQETWDLIPMVMIDGKLYLDTGQESTAEGRCGVMDGEIISEVDGSEEPTEDNQSNFGTGYEYQFGAMEGTVEIYMNGKWWIFAAEEARNEIKSGFQ